MKATDFCYWLQGFFEIAGAASTPSPLSLNTAQVETIQRHLSLVFVHDIDPQAGPPAHQALLNGIHDGTAAPFRPGDGGPVKMRC